MKKKSVICKNLSIILFLLLGLINIPIRIYAASHTQITDEQLPAWQVAILIALLFTFIPKKYRNAAIGVAIGIGVLYLVVIFVRFILE